jgi:abortive infection Abi-like protein
VTTDRYDRFAIARPEYLGDQHWNVIDLEVGRLHRSLRAGDDSQALADLKCLIESVARVTLDIAGSPADPNESFDGAVTRAHDLLAKQPGHELAIGSEYVRMASQASKIAKGLGIIRNEYGGGHGRARVPHVRDEMVDLTLDGALTWVRWALRRLGSFRTGVPMP